MIKDINKSVKVFTAAFKLMRKLELSDNVVLNNLIFLSDNNGCIQVNKEMVDIISEKSRLHSGTVNNSLGRLCKVVPIPIDGKININWGGPILIRTSRGNYRLSPMYIYKKGLSNRSKDIKDFIDIYNNLHDRTFHPAKTLE